METYDLTVSAELAEAAKASGSSEFGMWIRWAIANQEFELLITAAIKAGKADTPQGAFDYLKRFFTANGLDRKRKVNWADLSRSSSNRKLFNELRELIKGEKISASSYDPTRHYGIVGHVAIPDLFAGKLVRFEKSGKKVPSEQLTLFQNGYPYELISVNGSTPKPNERTGRMLVRLMDEIEEKRQLIARDMRSGSQHHSQTFRKMKYQMTFIFRKYMEKLFNRDSRDFLNDEYLLCLTLMSWAGALTHFRSVGPCPIFREVSVLPFKDDVGAGRIDALKVTSIEGRAPTKTDLKKISHLAEKHYDSVGHVILALSRTFRTHLGLKIVDWKFAVGDCPSTERAKEAGKAGIIKSDSILTKALPEHISQINRYMSMAMLSHFVASKSDLAAVEEIWETSRLSIEGEIVYFLPDSLPVVHNISLTPSEMKAVFRDQIATPFRNASFRSRCRYSSQKLMKHAIWLISGNDQVDQTARPDGQTAMAELLKEAESRESKASVVGLIDLFHEPVFADETKIIEIVGKDKHDKDVVRMHLDRLLSEIFSGNGRIEAKRNFSAVKGGFLNCLVHSENTPSMHVNISKGIFKCFGCGIGGIFADHSIPDNLAGVVKMTRKVVTSQALKIDIPERHQNIMKAALEYTQSRIERNHELLRYMCSRGLGTRQAEEAGLGYADHNLIKNLLEKGFTFDELIMYGFVGLSEYVKPDNPFLKVFLECGLALNDISREDFASRSGKAVKVPHRPYPVLDKMATFPLEIGGIINSFYGRSIDPNCPKHRRHRKLIAGDMPHGGFNIHKAMNSGERFLLVTEACLDVLTFYQTTVSRANCGLVGVNNSILVEIISGFDGSIVIAFDWDEAKTSQDGRQVGLTGQRNTQTLSEQLRGFGFRGKIFDFTAGFKEKFPNLAYKDINQFWKSHFWNDLDIYRYMKRLEI